MSEIEKLNNHTDEWNDIYPFIEWLHENHMCIAKWRDPNTPFEVWDPETGGTKTGTIKEDAEYLLDHPYLVGLPIENILYQYFDVDPAKLEEERRAFLEELREKQETV